MSRWKRLEELETRLDDMTASELRSELPFWKTHAERLRGGPAHKLALKWLRRLEKALEQKESETDY